MENIKVSIIVGIYNSDKFLRKGLESIQNQTWKNIEVLLMNDGSPDKSGEICDEFAEQDKRFIHIKKENSGVCDSRNMGLDLATGDYVCFMDGDDWLSLDFVEYMMNLILNNNVSMALSDNVFTTLDQVQISSDEIKVVPYTKIIPDITYLNMVLGPWNKMYSMKLIKEHSIKFPAHWFGETLHFANTVAYYSKEIALGHRKVYNYRLNNAGSGTTNYNVQNRLYSLNNCLNLRKLPFANEKVIKNSISWHIYENYFILLTNIIATNEKEKYIDKYKEAKKYIHRHWLSVFLKSKLNLRRRIIVMLEGVFTISFAKIRIKRTNKKHSSVTMY